MAKREGMLAVPIRTRILKIEYASKKKGPKMP